LHGHLPGSGGSPAPPIPCDGAVSLTLAITLSITMGKNLPQTLAAVPMIVSTVG
jgi:hypothetical protein